MISLLVPIGGLVWNLAPVIPCIVIASLSWPAFCQAQLSTWLYLQAGFFLLHGAWHLGHVILLSKRQHSFDSRLEEPVFFLRLYDLSDLAESDL